MKVTTVVAILIVLWVVGILGWMCLSMSARYVHSAQLNAIRIRIAVVIGGLISILALYGNSLLQVQ